jgi:hypothetical protein
MFVKRILAAAALVGGAVAATAVPASAGGVSGPAFYVDGVVYRTVGTPAQLSGTGAPDHTYDLLWNLGDHQLAVSETAPGYRDYNGGRWEVHTVGLPNGYAAALASGDADENGVLDSVYEVKLAMAAGDATDGGVVARFVCTVNRFPASS